MPQTRLGGSAAPIPTECLEGTESFAGPMKIQRNKVALLLASSLTTLAVGVGILEVVFHKASWHDVNTRFDPLTGWVTTPNASVTENGHVYSHNSLGFRSPEVVAGGEQILLVGDSTIWGYGVDDAETAASLLDQRIDGLQVLNLGVSGYGIDQYYLHLERHLSNPSSVLRPAWIIVTIFTGNDLLDTSTNVRYRKSKPLFVVDREAKDSHLGDDGGAPASATAPIHLEREFVSRYSCHNLFSRSWIFGQGLLRKIPYRLCPPHSLSSHDRRVVVDSLLGKIAALAAQHDSELLFVLHPSTLDFRFPGESGPVSESEEAELSIPERAMVKGRRFFLERLGMLGYPTLDFWQSIHEDGRDLGSLYLDFVHLSPQGNQLLADTLAERIAQKR